VLVLAIGGVGFALTTRTETAVLPPPPSATPGAAREAAAAELLTDLVDALQDGDPSRLRELAAPTPEARREIDDLAANVRNLDLADLSMRYLDENEGRSVGGLPARLRDKAWVADVQLTWRLADHDESPATLEVGLAFLETEDGAAFVSARGGWGRQTPLWLLHRLSVAESRRTLVMAATGRSEARVYDAMARRAVRDVAKVLPGWRGSVVVAVPRSEKDVSRVLASSSSYGGIAAVTAPADGSLAPSAPTRIFINPAVFDPLGEQGAQIVMSHEAAHVATDAAISTMPTWLLEGFADYVALAHVDLPVEVTASQILAQARREGPPRRLPGEADFESENKRLGASYEAAWLACRLIEERYGERRLIEFYERADRDGETDAAFREVLGTTQRELTAAWRDELRELAG
jgi:hypothetical protein